MKRSPDSPTLERHPSSWQYFQSTQIAIADLPGTQLGSAGRVRITLDIDAGARLVCRSDASGRFGIRGCFWRRSLG
ncbi:MAG: hypothetical protein R3C05_22385 [Pirellulaceae bacterium]